MFLAYVCPQYCPGYTYTKKLFVVYLKFKFNWASCLYFWLNLAILPHGLFLEGLENKAAVLKEGSQDQSISNN